MGFLRMCSTPLPLPQAPCDRCLLPQLPVRSSDKPLPCAARSRLEDACLAAAAVRPRALSAEARLGRSNGGAGVLERPGFDQSQVYQEPQVEEGGEIGKLMQKRSSGGGNRYRVLLLDHEKHTESRVTSALPKAVPTVTVDEARKCFFDSREKGVGIVTITVKEHAEFYAQMMARSGLRSGIEPDGDTV